MDLEQARDEIRHIDEQMAPLFVKRMEAVREIAAYKSAHGLPVEDEKQEEHVIAGRSALVEDEQMRPFYVEFLRGTLDVSKRWQQQLIDGQSPADGSR